MMKTLRHTLRVALGIGLVLIGIVGLILPVMPGWIFLIPGLLILGDYFPPVRRLVHWAKSRFAEAEQQFRKQKGSDPTDGPTDAATSSRPRVDPVAGGSLDSQQ